MLDIVIWNLNLNFAVMILLSKLETRKYLSVRPFIPNYFHYF